MERTAPKFIGRLLEVIEKEIVPKDFSNGSKI